MLAHLTNENKSLSVLYTALHGMQTRSSDENNTVCLPVRLSVCLSVKRMHCDKTKEKSIQIFIPYERSFILVFWKKMFVGGDSFFLKFWINWPPLERNRRFWTDRSAPAVRPSEKSSINTNRNFTTRFPMSLRWSSYVEPKSPKGAQKRKTAVVTLKSHIAWRKSATKFLCVKTVSGKL